MRRQFCRYGEQVSALESTHDRRNVDAGASYQKEESEAWLGEWMEKRDLRDQMVIATKYTSNFNSTKVCGQITMWRLECTLQALSDLFSADRQE